MALSSNGDTFTWGVVAMYGQLGHGNQFDVKDYRKVDRNILPTRGVERLSTETIVKVACGANMICSVPALTIRI